MSEETPTSFDISVIDAIPPPITLSERLKKEKEIFEKKQLLIDNKYMEMLPDIIKNLNMILETEKLPEKQRHPNPCKYHYIEKNKCMINPSYHHRYTSLNLNTTEPFARIALEISYLITDKDAIHIEKSIQKIYHILYEYYRKYGYTIAKEKSDTHYDKIYNIFTICIK